MTVIYLPQDTRWSDAAKGLGQLIGSAVSGYLAKQQSTDIANIQANPNMTQDQKTTQVMQKYGDDGVKTLTNFLKTQQLRAQLGLENAQAGHLQAGTSLEESETAKNQAVLPTLAAQQAANLAATQASTQHTQAETQAIPAQTAETQARTTYLQGPQTAATTASTAHTTAETANVPGQGAETAARTDLLTAQKQVAQQQANEYKRLFEDGGLVPWLNSMGITDPKDIAQVQEAGITGGPSGFTKPMNEAITKITDARRKTELEADKPKMAPEDIRKNVTNAASQANTLETFLKPPAPGTPSGFSAGMIADLQKRGILQTDPDLMARATAADQAKAQYASSGGGFGGSWRVKLAESVVPQVQHSPIGNVIDVDTISSDKLKELQSQKAQMIPGMDTKFIDDEIAHYQQIKAQADSLWWTQPIDAAGKQVGDGKVHFYYGNNEVDKNLQVIKPNALLGADTTYKNAQGQTVKGDALNWKARQLGIDPQLYARMAGFQ